MNQCSRCGATAAPSDQFCAKCGASLTPTPETPSPDVTIETAVPPFSETEAASESTPAETDAPEAEQIPCRVCGATVITTQRFCGNCSAPVAAPPVPPQWGAPPVNPSWPPSDPANDSGQRGGVPPEVARCRWHWGAFGTGWLWLFNHRMVPAGLALFLANVVLGNLPRWAPHASSSWQIVGFLAYLGVLAYMARNGHKLAWRLRRYEGGVPQFMATEGVWSRIGIMITALYSLVMASVVISTADRVRDNARQRSSVNNLKQIGLALEQYAQDNDEMLPPMETPEQFKVALYPYVKSDPVFVQTGKNVPYSVNSALSHKSLIDLPLQTEVAEESVAGYDHKIARLYVDGTVRLEPEDGSMASSEAPADGGTEQNAAPQGTPLHKFQAGDTWTYDFIVTYSNGRKLVAKDICTVVPVTVQNAHHLKMQQTISGKVGGIPVSVDDSELFDQDAQGNYVAIGNYSGPGHSVKVYPEGDPHHGIVYPGTWMDDGGYGIAPGAIQVTLPDKSSRTCWKVIKREADGIDTSTYCPSIGSLVVAEGKSPKMRVVTRLRSYKLANGEEQ
jgi:type II secretory pathway pseudopilin PulG